MADGQWVTVTGNLTQSGKPERRYRMESGQYRTTEPYSAEWYDAMYGQPARNIMGGIRDFMNGLSMGTDALSRSLTRTPLQAAEQKPVPNRVPPDPSYKQQELELAAAAEKSTPVVQTLLSDDANARESALTAMRQQYMPGASVWGTDEGKAIMQAAIENQYTGDAGGLANYYANQQKAGQGGIEEIISSMGYEGDMAKWARANQGLALREYNKKMANQPAPFATADNQVITTAEDGTQRIGEGMYGYVPELDGPSSVPGEIREANNNSQTAELQGKQMYDRALALLQAAQRGN